MNIQQKRACAQGETKEGTTRSGASSPTERHCADKAPLRQQGATHKRNKTKFPFCVVLKTYHLDTWILHKTCLKHSNFFNRKLCVQLFPTWNTTATAMGQGTEGKTRHAKKRIETRFRNTAITTFWQYNVGPSRSTHGNVSPTWTSATRLFSLVSNTR